MVLRIRFVGGVQDGETHPINERGLTIGRSPSNSVYVRDKNVSRAHAQIELTDQGCVISDLQSTNGTVVNGERITEEKVLKEGDVVRVGTSTFRVEEVEEETPDTDTTALTETD